MAKMLTPAMEKLERTQSRKPRKTGPWYEAWYRLRRNRMAMIGLGIIVLLIIFALFP